MMQRLLHPEELAVIAALSLALIIPALADLTTPTPRECPAKHEKI